MFAVKKDGKYYGRAPHFSGEWSETPSFAYVYDQATANRYAVALGGQVVELKMQGWKVSEA